MGKAVEVDGENNQTAPESDPAKMLEAALLQMDGIIADAASAGGGTLVNNTGGRASRARAVDLAAQLAAALHHAAPPPPRPDFTTTSAILRWLNAHNNASSLLSDAEERVRRLESDKESLLMQAQALSEQVAAQQDKINDLEKALYDTKHRLDDAEQALQKEMLSRSSLETQKLELLSRLSEMRLRVAERGVLERSPPPAPDPAPPHLTPPPPPRTPPANYGRMIERGNAMYSSLPRGAVSPMAALYAAGTRARDAPPAQEDGGGPHRGHSVPNLAGIEERDRGSPSPSVRAPVLEGGAQELVRGPLRATAMPRLCRDRPATPPLWQTKDFKEWDVEATCSWLESLSMEAYIPAARAWMAKNPDARGLIAAAGAQTLERELNIKHPMHRKKINLALMDLQGSEDPYLECAGKLDTAWVSRWVEDVGACVLRDAFLECGVDGRVLHALTHRDLHAHLHPHSLVHALALRRGIQVLRENKFNPDTMIRRGRVEGEGISDSRSSPTHSGSGSGDGPTEGEGLVPSKELCRWSSHRVMQWLTEIDLAEYAPNLRGAGVHGGLLVYEDRFTAELLASLLNIGASKTLLRRHLTQRFNELIGRTLVHRKRSLQHTLGAHPLTPAAKYKVPKKSQFSLKRKSRKDREEIDVSDLVCPLHEDELSGETNGLEQHKLYPSSAIILTGQTRSAKWSAGAASAVYHPPNNRSNLTVCL